MKQTLSAKRITQLLRSRGTQSVSREQLSRLILETAENSPHRVILRDSETEFTGSKLLKFMRSMKSYLDAFSLEGSRVAIFFPNSAAQAVGILAVLYSKRVPILMNPDLPQEKIAERLKQFNCSLVVATPDSPCSTLPLPKIFVSLAGEFIEIKSLSETKFHALPDPSVALVLFTSGSTGSPKAVQVTLDGLFYTVRYLRKYFSLDHRSRAGISLPIYHTMALNTQFLPSFLSGGECVFMNSETEQTRAFSSILEQKADFLTVIGDILFLYEKERDLRGLPVAEHVKHVQMAGGLIRKDHLDLARLLFPNARLYKGYGLTECIRTAMIDSDDPDFFADNVGRVLPGQDVEIRNERGRVLSLGQTGQIFIKGPNLMLGYQGERNPFDPNGFLATGDLGFVDERGILHFSGRTDDIFKTLGKKVSTIEIERAAMGLDIVELAKCIAVPCAKKGLKAVLVVQAAATYEKKKIEDLCRTVRHYLRGQLEKYKVPAEVLFVDTIPRLSNQKVNRRAVYDLWLQWDAQR